jgi:hypothetical protein
MQVCDVDGLRTLRDGFTHLLHDGASISASSSTRLLSRSSLKAHIATITEPTRPMTESSQAKPRSMPPSNAAMAMTDVAASAITCR